MNFACLMTLPPGGKAIEPPILEPVGIGERDEGVGARLGQRELLPDLVCGIEAMFNSISPARDGVEGQYAQTVADRDFEFQGALVIIRIGAGDKFLGIGQAVLVGIPAGIGWILGIETMRQFEVVRDAVLITVLCSE